VTSAASDRIVRAGCHRLRTFGNFGELLSYNVTLLLSERYHGGQHLLEEVWSANRIGRKIC